MKTYLWISILLISYNITTAQSEEDKIEDAINTYIEGTSYNLPEKIKDAFYEEANLYLSHKEKNIWIVPINEYASWFKNKEKGKFNGRTGKILSVDRENDIAMAKAEILIAKNDMHYIDIFLLKRIKSKWKIISKAATTKIK